MERDPAQSGSNFKSLRHCSISTEAQRNTLHTYCYIYDETDWASEVVYVQCALNMYFRFLYRLTSLPVLNFLLHYNYQCYIN